MIYGFYDKHTTIVNDASIIANKLEALLTDDARVIIYDCHVFIVQATSFNLLTMPFITENGTIAAPYFSFKMVFPLPSTNIQKKVVRWKYLSRT